MWLKIRTLKLKIMIYYINDTTSPVILILPSLASSPRMRFKSASLIPVHFLRPAPLHLPAAVGKCPQDATSRRLGRGIVRLMAYSLF
jgi:hypothetical protein